MHDFPNPQPMYPDEDPGGAWADDPTQDSQSLGVQSGIAPLDARMGGLVEGGVYLVAGAPGPAKLVGILQFLHTGLELGERSLLLTDARAPGILEVARAWGLDVEPAWRDGRLEIIGFRDDFEMRVLRSADPEDAIEELQSLVAPDTTRIAVDPGSAFFQGGARSLVGRTFLNWAQAHRATVWTTLVVDEGEGLPSSAEWLVNATQGVFLFDQGRDGLQQVRVRHPLPVSGPSTPVTLELAPGKGLIPPSGDFTRRSSDHMRAAADRLLLVSCGEPPAGDLEGWVRGAFTARMTTDPIEAVSALQGDEQFGSVLVYSSRTNIREAIRIVRVMRPLTRSPIIVTSDDPVRSMDRVEMLDVGADDCLTGGVDVRELAARIRHAIEAGGKPKRSHRRDPGPPPAAPVGGPVGGDVFDDEVRRRAADPTLGVFAIVLVRTSVTTPDELQRVLADEIRSEEGDLVTGGADGFVVLLQGARGEGAHVFVDRFRHRLSHHLGKEAELVSDVLVHPADRKRVLDVLDRTGSR